MKPFQDLTYLGQVRRLRRLAQAALQYYGLADAQFKLVVHSENTTFRVDAPHAIPGKTVTGGLYVANRFLLRIHLPGYQSAESIASELAWLAALRAEAGLAVPEPVPTLQGELLAQASAPGVPEQRICSLLRWMEGRFYKRRPRLAHLTAMGQLIARLHNHAARWRLPPGFTRRHCDWDGLFGDDAGFNLCGQTWALLPRPYYDVFRLVADQARSAMRQLEQETDARGLIHADLDMSNVLFYNGAARAIDFDDCGFGYWVYDLAAVLHEYLGYENWLAFRDALLCGYARLRPLPDKQLEHLDALVAARIVSLTLWYTDRAQVNPGVRKNLAEHLEWAAGHARKFIDGL